MHYSRAIKFNRCYAGGPQKPSCSLLLLISYLALILFSFPAYASNLPIRGQARGESKIKVGDKAPLITEELQSAHEGGKVIALMLGYQTHCPWCDRMDRYIRVIMKATNSFDDRVSFVQTQIEHAKMIAPPAEGLRLKEAYGVEGQPWLFIIDKGGTVRYVYKIFISSDVFIKNINELLGDNVSIRDLNELLERLHEEEGEREAPGKEKKDENRDGHE
ncbi:MAG: hypothetical protein HZC13_06305 [Nitrospirae bacterium]|nr:hypothetical protein [Nitrospirota bacterium]MBI5406679.1 hypothetical protein [Nitrospirota bacterium]